MKTEVEEIEKGVYFLKGRGKGSHNYLIRASYRNVLIDPGLDQNFLSLQEKLLSLGLKLRDIDLVINTHEHLDHIGANRYFQEYSLTAAHRFAAAKITLEDPSFILVPTIFDHFRQVGVFSALLTCKAKILKLVGSKTKFAVEAEDPAPEVLSRYGTSPSIYSAEVNYWLWTIAIDLLKKRPDIGLLYVQTTDYPMHMWAPDDARSLKHMAMLDDLLQEASMAAPDAAFLITADHGMNRKRQCWDLARVCSGQGIPLRFVLSPERDYYIRHHRNFAGSAWIWVMRTMPTDPCMRQTYR